MKQIWTILISAALIQAGIAAYYNFFSVYIYDLTHSNIAVTLFASISFAAYALTARFWGALSDFYAARKPFIVYGMLITGLSMLLFIPAMKSWQFIIVVSILVSLATAVFMPATLAAVPGTGKTGEAFGLFDAASSLGWGAGSLLMGLIAADEGYVILLASLLTISAGMIILLGLQKQDIEPRNVKHISIISTLKDSYRFVSNGSLKFLYLTVLLGWFAIFWYAPLIRLQLFYVITDSSWKFYGMALAGASLTSIIASPIAGRLCDKIGGMRILTAAILAYVLYIPILILTRNILIFMILWILPIWSFFYTGIYTSGVHLSKPERRGEVMGSLEACREVSGSIAPLCGGRIADLTDRTTSVLIAPLFLLGAFGVMGLLRKNMMLRKVARLKV